MHLSDIESYLSQKLPDFAEKRAETQLLLYEMGISNLTLRFNPRPLTAAETQKVEQYCLERQKGIPPQYILGNAAFRQLVLKVSPAVLIPRPETEELVDLALQWLKDKPQARVADIGTGSGAIALALKAERPDLEIWATDISAEALNLAQSNAKRLELEVIFRQGDKLLALGSERFDLLLSNPPYIPLNEYQNLEKQVRDYEPQIALTPGEDCQLFYRHFANNAQKHLKPKGAIGMECSHSQAYATQVLFSKHYQTELHRDLQGQPRHLWAQS